MSRRGCGQDELKSLAPAGILRRPKPALIGLNDRTADRKAHSDAVGLGAEEGIENSLSLRGRNARA